MDKLGSELIVDEIFTRLPVKAIGRFKGLSKFYRNELSNDNFEIMHSRRILSSLQKKLLSLKDNSIVVDNIVREEFARRYNQNHNFSIECPSFFLTCYSVV
ncbi:hypothetical protein Hanom_Chr16g01419361 [Helianthus anomalus]